MPRITVAQRRQRTMIVTVVGTAGVSFAAGVGVAVWSCSNLPAIVASLAHSAWTFGLVFIVAWLTLCLIRALVTSCREAYALAERKQAYRDQGYSLVNGQLFLNGEMVEM